jgi:hypothetical protein
VKERNQEPQPSACLHAPLSCKKQGRKQRERGRERECRSQHTAVKETARLSGERKRVRAQLLKKDTSPAVRVESFQIRSGWSAIKQRASTAGAAPRTRTLGWSGWDRRKRGEGRGGRGGRREREREWGWREFVGAGFYGGSAADGQPSPVGATATRGSDARLA